MDSYKDIFPWPYHWSKDIAGDVISALTVVRGAYEDASFWTYKNHISLVDDPTPTAWDRIVDVYWSDEGSDRLQLPLDVGDWVCDLMVTFHPEKVRMMIWMGLQWDSYHGWREYAGPQGDFVDHVHIEFEEGWED